jgi:hypothetical protein
MSNYDIFIRRSPAQIYCKSKQKHDSPASAAKSQGLAVWLGGMNFNRKWLGVKTSHRWGR